MFYHLLTPLMNTEILGYKIFNVIQYVTFRSIAAFISALLFSLFIGPKLIRLLKTHKAVEIIADYMPENHKAKQGTPTMGGLIVLSGLLLSVLLWNDLTNNFVLILILSTVWLGGIGFLDDYLKNFRHHRMGLIAKYKLILQIALSLVVALILYYGRDRTFVTTINIPFLKSTILQLRWVFIPFVIFMIVGTSNAVNLTDGLDGLATGVIILSAFGLGIFAYLKGNYNIANYLNLEFLSNAGELTVFIAALIGTLLGFLWFNVKPAEIMLGDTGSLPLGGILAVSSILLREELLFALIGGVFVMEALSSMMQRYYFKYTRKRFGEGRRIFKCAPLHHHYEKNGMSEEKIVVRFWIIAILLLAVGLATLKLR